MDLKNRLGKRIKEYRLKNQMTQFELSEIVNIAPKHQSCIENGKNFPSAELIEKYANAFNVDVSEILDVSEEINYKKKQEKVLEIIKNANKEQISVIYKILKNLY